MGGCVGGCVGGREREREREREEERQTRLETNFFSLPNLSVSDTKTLSHSLSLFLIHVPTTFLSLTFAVSKWFISPPASTTSINHDTSIFQSLTYSLRRSR